MVHMAYCFLMRCKHAIESRKFLALCSAGRKGRRGKYPAIGAMKEPPSECPFKLEHMMLEARLEERMHGKTS